MRDPGAPRRNPLFAVDPGRTDTADGATDETTGDTTDGAGATGRSSELPTADAIATASALLRSVGDASPEALEHLLTAGKEVIAAMRILLDAAERAIDESMSGSDPDVPREERVASTGHRGRVRKIDLG